VIGTIWISMRAEDAERIFTDLAENARQAIGRDGALDVTIDAEYNARGARPVRLVFNNDDMERPEVAGRTIVEWE
jgi:hypothetical protein